jgi:hypothetical protein
MKNILFAFIALVSLHISASAQYSLSQVNKVSQTIKKNTKAAPDKLAALITASLGKESSQKSREAVSQMIKARQSHRASIKAMPVAHRIYDHVITSLVSMRPGVPTEWCKDNRYRFEFSLGLVSKLVKDLTDCINENTTADVIGMLDNVLLNPSRLLGEGDYSELFRDCEEQIHYLTDMMDFISDFNALCN